MRLEVRTNAIDQDGNFVFGPGVAHSTITLCEGECGSVHRWAAVLATGATSFTLTE